MSAADTLRARVAVVVAAAADDLVSLRLVFSRDTVLALADLLDALRRQKRSETDDTYAAWVALEQAIERRSGND